ncbi:hypothetical protein EDC04DRAFT_2713982 [Pisolithus marmoratus]|nr:hypothetical protein EDC04DRAFT_2795846 [Pisolithus marmoratus]KAI6023384.1 hypothetical protein EDC04DRAFT_2726515 [Pisolithus marmoratus]KAI6030030.1 hypothetical protein EDC04DRAFT_2713982 [Pisolithus marmoratus]
MGAVITVFGGGLLLGTVFVGGHRVCYHNHNDHLSTTIMSGFLRELRRSTARGIRSHHTAGGRCGCLGNEGTRMKMEDT